MKTLIMAAGVLALGIAAAAPAHATYGTHTAPTASHGIVNATYGIYRIPLHRIITGLKHKGYTDFKSVAWRDNAYVVTARGNYGHWFKITVNAYNGYIVDIDRIFFRRHWRWSY